MDRFTYFAIDLDGNDIRGRVEARSARDAFSKLAERGLTPVRITSPRQSVSLDRFRPLTRKNLAVMVRQLAVLLNAGVPMIDAVSSLSRTSAHPALAERAGNVHARLKTGEPLSSSLSEEFPTLPVYVAQMAELGEATGRVGPALMEAADQFEHELEIASQVRSALTYPIFLVVVGSMIVLLMFLFVVPRFADLLDGSDADIPAISRAVIGFSLWLKSNFLLAALLFIVTAIAAVAGIRALKGGVSGFIETLPILGNYQMTSTLASWSRTMGGALRHGSGLLPAMELAERGVRAPRLRSGLSLCRQSVRKGETLDEAIERNVPNFDRVAIDMIRTGRTSGKLSEMLLFSSEIFRRETDERTRRFTALVEPISILFISLVIGTIVISIVLAMTSLYEISP